MSRGLAEPDVGQSSGIGEQFCHLAGGKPRARFATYEFQRLGDMFVVQRKQPRRSPAHNPEQAERAVSLAAESVRVLYRGMEHGCGKKELSAIIAETFPASDSEAVVDLAHSLAAETQLAIMLLGVML